MAIASNEQSRLLSLVRNNQENDLVVAFAGKTAISKLTHKEKLQVIDLVGYWMATLGIMNSISTQEIQMIAMFIIDDYGYLTIDEIKKAINLSIKGKLDCDVELYNKKFSTRYVSKILEAYSDYKYEVLKDYRERLRHQDELDKEVTPKEKMQICIESLKSSYEDATKPVPNISYLYVHYDYLVNKKHLFGVFREKFGELYDKMLLEAQEYGAKKAKQIIERDYTNSIGRLMSDFTASMQTSIVEKHTKNYYVYLFFKTTNFEELINSITEKEFE